MKLWLILGILYCQYALAGISTGTADASIKYVKFIWSKRDKFVPGIVRLPFDSLPIHRQNLTRLSGLDYTLFPESGEDLSFHENMRFHMDNMVSYGKRVLRDVSSGYLNTHDADLTNVILWLANGLYVTESYWSFMRHFDHTRMDITADCQTVLFSWTCEHVTMAQHILTYLVRDTRPFVQQLWDSIIFAPVPTDRRLANLTQLWNETLGSILFRDFPLKNVPTKLLLPECFAMSARVRAMWKSMYASGINTPQIDYHDNKQHSHLPWPASLTGIHNSEGLEKQLEFLYSACFLRQNGAWHMEVWRASEQVHHKDPRTQGSRFTTMALEAIQDAKKTGRVPQIQNLEAIRNEFARQYRQWHKLD